MPLPSSLAYAAAGGAAPGVVESADVPRVAPAAQLRPAFVTLAAATAPGATQTLSIRLDPVELGRVEIRIDRSGTGPARIELLAERPETLRTLMGDSAGLSRALDLAGIGAERTVQFSLASPEAPAQAGSSPVSQAAAAAEPGMTGTGPDPTPPSTAASGLDPSVAGGGGGGLGFGGSGFGAPGFGASAGSGGSGGGFGGRSAWQGEAEDDGPRGRAGPSRRRFGAGIDITA